MSSGSGNGIVAALCEELVRDIHIYRPGQLRDRPTLARPPQAGLLGRAGDLRERGRDALERAAGRAGFTRRHYDPREAGSRLSRIVELAPGLESTAADLGDESSRRALIDVLKLRILGPYHTSLVLSPQEFRHRQSGVERTLRLQEATFEVSDPWFSPLSLYRVQLPSGESVTLHSHSAEVLSVYLLEQYAYGSSGGVRAAPGDIVLDVGGCWGDTALYFASLVGDSGRVYTFEFDPESLQVLRSNLELNPELAARVVVVERALWDATGEVLSFTQAGGSTTITSGHDGRHSVEAITLDDFVAQEGLDRVSFVKMDVEGAELRVLAGARGSLQRFAPRMAVAAYHRDDDLVRLPAELLKSQPDYSLYLKSSSALEDETVLFASP